MILKNRKFILLSLIIVSLLVIGGLGLWGSKSKAPQYQTATVERGNIVSSVSVSGSVLGSNFKNVTTEASGIVSSVFIKEGERVTAGQKIAQITLDSDGLKNYQQDYSSYLSAKNNLESAYSNQLSLHAQMVKTEDDFNNNSSLKTLNPGDPVYLQAYENLLVSKQKYAQSASSIDQAKLSLSNAGLTYQMASPIISAPVSGVVMSLLVTPSMTLTSSSLAGSSASAASSTSQKVAIIKMDGKTLASFNVTEVDIDKVKIGQKATITLDSLTDQSFTGTVVAIDRVGSTSNGVTNYPVTISFDSDAPQILPNMSASANIIIDSKENVLLIPSSAIQTQNGQSVVRVLENGQERAVIVQTGLSSDTQTEITAGLSQGQTIIVSTLSATSNTSRTSGTSVFGGYGGSGGRANTVFRP